jgi:hypothetical protein
MGLDGTIKRRVAAGICLAAAVGLLVLGQTVFQSRLSPPMFLLYWAACFVLTCAAILIALRDARFQRQKIRHEQKSLLEDTLRRIESEARRKRMKNGRGHFPRR